MSPFQLILLSLLLISFLLSIFFCASEIAFSSINRIKVRLWSRAGKIGASTIEKFVTDPEKFLVPSLIGTNIASVVYASSIAYILIEFKINSLSHFEVTIYETLILVLFAEVIPKVVVKNNTEKSIFTLIYPFAVVNIVFIPISFFMRQASLLIMKVFRLNNDDSENLLVTKKDIEGIIAEAASGTIFDEQEKEFINNVLDLRESKVKEIMTHRSNLIGIETESSLYKLKRLISTTSYSKIIVYEDDFDNIKGVIFANDLFTNPGNLQEITKELKFIPANTSVYSLFNQLKQEKITIAAIIDEFGGCIGIVTMQDILNEIIGKVTYGNQNAKEDTGISYRVKKNILIVNGEVEIDLLNKKLEEISRTDIYNIKNDKYETINGFVINHLQRIPAKGENFRYNNLEYKIIRAQKNRIKNITINLERISV